MTKLHIVQGGKNGDKKWIEKAARKKLSSPSWIVPKSVQIGDDVVIYIGGHGFFGTARVTSLAKRRRNWKRRYGASLDRVTLIEPAISLGVVRKRLPQLRWADYPRSITTVAPHVASAIRRLIKKRRVKGIADMDFEVVEKASLDELRALAYLNARTSTDAKRRMVSYRLRSKAVHLYVLGRASGYCEGCDAAAPFERENGVPYLEPHHTTRA